MEVVLQSVCFHSAGTPPEQELSLLSARELQIYAGADPVLILTGAQTENGHQYGSMQKYPLIGSLREKEGQHPVLEVYYFHISCYVCEPLGPL